MNTRPATATVARSLRTLRDRLLLQEDLNFLLTNRVPRILLTRLMGWYSRLESPLLTRLSIAVWRLFTELDLREAVPQRYRSLRECFIRELKPGARPIDPDPEVLTSPCDAIVGACGTVHEGELLQAKGMPYQLAELLGSAALAQRWQGAQYVTLRLTSSMYHRFHAPADARIERVRYIAGDAWNVNPVALARVQRLFCRNERAVIEMTCAPRPAEPDPDGGRRLLLVPVAAILVASIRLHFLNLLLHLRWKGANVIDCDVPVHKGQELGWFEHGSTIIVFLPPGARLCASTGARLRMGQALARRSSPERLSASATAQAPA